MQYNGYSPDGINNLVSDGFTLEETEEYIYCYYKSCINYEEQVSVFLYSWLTALF